MTKLYYAVNGIKNGQVARDVIEAEYYPSLGSIENAIEFDKAEIKRVQELNGWTQVTVEYRGQFNG